MPPMGAPADLVLKILLPFDPRQASPPRYYLGPGHQDSELVHGRAEETVTDRFQGHDRQGRDEGRS